MTVLQNRWYNGLVGSLPGLTGASFQLSLPSFPVPPRDRDWWRYADAVPPRSLTFDRRLSSPSFFDGYAGVAAQLARPEVELERAIGEPAYGRWTAYLAQLVPPPPPADLPRTFRDWAITNAPSAMMAGASALARASLREAGRAALAPYLGPAPKPVDFTPGFADLLRIVEAAPATRFTVTGATPSDVASTWAEGVQRGLDGLWSRSDPGGGVSRRFAAGDVRVDARFGHVASVTCAPGAWYSSGLLHTLYDTRDTPPWIENPDPSWDDAFGEDGFLRRFATSLLVVDGTRITVTSDARLSRPERTALEEHAAAGLWPLYAPAGEAVSPSVRFDGGETVLETVVEPGHPLVVGAVVLGISTYLGR
ncbi:MAG TPA: hypothetical protein VF100_08590 [Thermoanaerobaculia bacterium]